MNTDVTTADVEIDAYETYWYKVLRSMATESDGETLVTVADETPDPVR